MNVNRTIIKIISARILFSVNFRNDNLSTIVYLYLLVEVIERLVKILVNNWFNKLSITRFVSSPFYQLFSVLFNRSPPFPDVCT